MQDFHHHAGGRRGIPKARARMDGWAGTFKFVSILLRVKKKKNPIKLGISQSRGKNLSWGKKKKIPSDDVFRPDS